MACLFGYFGRPAHGLLARMATLLAHRCKQGWEHQPLLATKQYAEIGHGIATWCENTQVALLSESADTKKAVHLVYGYAGRLFNREPLACASALLHSPLQTLTQLEGAFSCALALPDRGYLIRDAAGIKALYWTLCNGRLLFASEIKALFADPNVPKNMRLGALPEYFSFSFIPGQNTFFQDIYELQAGHSLCFFEGKVTLRRFFRFEDCQPVATKKENPAVHIRAIRQALAHSVEECCIGTHCPAVFLSGGIDSSAVLAMLRRCKPEARIPSFSVHFGPDYANENEFIALMAKHCHSDHHWLTLRPDDFHTHMRKMVWHLDEPIGDPVTLPNYLLARAASQENSVALNGEGGDPCFGGPKNIPMLLARLYGPAPHEAATGWLEKQYLYTFKRCYQDLQSLLDPDLLREAGGEEALIEILRPFFSASTPSSFLNRLMSMNIRLKGANLILVKVDKMSSAHGLLALAPLFSKRIIEASMACPTELKLEGAVEKMVLKRAVEDLVPQTIIARPKSGMRVPVRFWFQDELRRYACKRLSPQYLKRTGFFNAAYVQKLLQYDREGVHGLRHGLKIWMLLTFLLWYEQMEKR